MVAKKFVKPFDLMVYEGLRALEEKIWENMEESVLDAGNHIERCQAAGGEAKGTKDKIKAIQKALAKVTKSKKDHMMKMRETQRIARAAFATLLPEDEETPPESAQQQLEAEETQLE